MRQTIMRKYVEFTIKWSWGVIGAVLALTVLLAWQLGKLAIDMDPDIWAPQQHPYVLTTKKLQNTFDGTNIIVVGVAPKHGDIYNPKVLEKIRFIQAGIERLPDAIRHNIVSLAASKVKDIRGTSDGMTAKPFMKDIPRSESDLSALKNAVARNPIYTKSLISEDGKSASIVADFKLDKANPLYAPLFEGVKKVVDEMRDDDVDIYIGGAPVQLAWFEYHINKMPMYFGIAFLIIMGIQYWSFRSIQGMLLPVVTSLFSVVWALGLMGLFGVHMDVLNTTTPILIMAIAAGHAIQMLKRYYEEYRRLSLLKGQNETPASINRLAIVESLERVGPVLIMTGLIAVVTFFSLMTSKISVVRHFGVFAGAGVLSALILELTFIPAVRSLLPPPRRSEVEMEHHVVLDRALTGLARLLSDGNALRLLIVGVLAIAVLFSGSIFLRVDNSLKRYNTPDSVVRTDDTQLNARFAGTNSLIFMIEGDADDTLKDPRVLRGIEAIQNHLNSNPIVGKTQSIVDLIKRMNESMHADDPRYDVIPDQRNEIAQYLLLYSLSGDPEDFSNFVDAPYRRAAIWVFLKDDSTVLAQNLDREVQQIAASTMPPNVSVRMGGPLAQLTAINEAITQAKFKNMAQIVVVVFLLSSLALRSLIGGIFIIVPLIAVVLANFGLMGWFGIPLDMGTAITAAMAMGVGADYELYLLFRFREELARTGDLRAATKESLLTSGKAIVFVAASVAGGYSILLMTGFGFYTRLSVVVIATMAISAFTALVFIRAMIMTFRPRFAFSTAPKLRSVVATT
jgi:hypothetical protein